MNDNQNTLNCDDCKQDVTPPLYQCNDKLGRCVNCYHTWLHSEEDAINSVSAVVDFLKLHAEGRRREGDATGEAWLLLGAERLNAAPLSFSPSPDMRSLVDKLVVPPTTMTKARSRYSGWPVAFAIIFAAALALQIAWRLLNG